MLDTKVPEGYRYTTKHEWIKIEGDTAIFGITDFAQYALGDIVFVDLPKIGRSVKQGESFGTIESVKAAEDIYAPLSGEIIEINTSLNSNPALVNEDAYSAWIIKIKNFHSTELSSLMDSTVYKTFLSKL